MTPSVKPVPIQLDQERSLILDLQAFCIAEEITGRNFLAVSTWSNLSFRDVRALAFAALQREKKPPTLDEVGGMLHPSRVKPLITALQSAFLESMPEAEANGGAPEGDTDPLPRPATALTS